MNKINNALQSMLQDMVKQVPQGKLEAIADNHAEETKAIFKKLMDAATNVAVQLGKQPASELTPVERDLVSAVNTMTMLNVTILMESLREIE